jgi:hypothetical protein
MLGTQQPPFVNPLLTRKFMIINRIVNFSGGCSPRVLYSLSLISGSVATYLSLLLAASAIL